MTTDVDHSEIISLVLEGRGKDLLTKFPSGDANQLRQELLHLRWMVSHELLPRFFDGILAVVSAWTDRGFSRRDVWELEYNVITYKDGAVSAITWLEGVARSGPSNSWMMHVLINDLLYFGHIQKARDFLNYFALSTNSPSLAIKFPLIEIYDGRWEKAKELLGVGAGPDSNDRNRARFSLSRISGEYVEALHALSERTDLPEAKKVHYHHQLTSYKNLDDKTPSSQMSPPPQRLQTYIITTDMLSARVRRLTQNMKIFDMRWTFIESINGKLIPPGWLERLVDENGSGANKGKHNFPDLAKRVGCFLGHYIAWNRIVKDERKSAIVVEDDALFHISPLNLLDAPNIEDYDFIFANERMEVALPTPVDDLQIYGIKETIENRVQQGYVGSDIYYLTFMMAKSLIALADETGPSFHLDGWLLNVAAKKFPDRFGSCAPCLGGQYDSFG